jgi:hypothetical protein
MSAVGAVGALSVAPAALVAMAAPGESPLTPDEVSALEGPLFVHVRDAATGEIEVFVGETSVVFTDKALVAKVLRATK